MVFGGRGREWAGMWRMERLAPRGVEGGPLVSGRTLARVGDPGLGWRGRGISVFAPGGGAALKVCTGGGVSVLGVRITTNIVL